MTQADHAGLLTQPQDLDEQTLESVEVPAPELADPAVVRLLVAGEHPKGQILVAARSILREETMPAQKA
jgi:hypothetical protein